jgi:hypothetical protein
MMEPKTYGIIALAVVALLCGMRRRRTGDGVDRDERGDGVSTKGIERWRDGK